MTEPTVKDIAKIINPLAFRTHAEWAATGFENGQTPEEANMIALGWVNRMSHKRAVAMERAMRIRALFP